MTKRKAEPHIDHEIATVASLMALLNAMGMRLAVHPIASKKASPQVAQ